jgi:hypothetical protein
VISGETVLVLDVDNADADGDHGPGEDLTSLVRFVVYLLCVWGVVFSFCSKVTTLMGA